MRRISTLTALLVFLFSVSSFSQQDLKKIDKKNAQINQNVINLQWDDTTYVIHCSDFHITKPLYQIVAEHPIIENKTYPFTSYPDQENKPVQTFEYTVKKDGSKYGNDPSIIQNKMGKSLSKAPIQNWAGQTATGFRPFDPTGAAGPNHYIQMINSTTYKIWDKAGNVLLTGTLGDLWSPATGNAGDPIVLYDKAADRWFMSQFGLPGNRNIYLAVSDGSNPVTSSWYTYTYTCPDDPDYLKFSAWQDGYYMTANYAEKIYAFNRTKMLAGDPSAEAVYKTYSPPASGFFVPLPADASDGVMPGAGTPCPIFCYSDNGWGGGNIDAVNIYNASVSWSGTPNMTITSAGSLPTNAFDGSYDPGWDDVDQPVTTQKLDGIGGAMMFRAQWKTWSGYNTVVLNWAVQVTSNQRGIFWCELRQDQTSGNWSIYQQGIYSPGTDHYWMGSIAMNDIGSIALAYAKANGSSTYMSLAYAGRLACDPLGTLPIAEVIAQTGSGSQTSSNRNGDYAQTCLDPDGITFWHTGEYMQSGGTAGTRVYSFQLPGSCAAPVVSNVTPTSLFKDRGKEIEITGSDLGGCTFTIGSITGTVTSNNGTTAVVTFPPGNYTNSTLTVSNSQGNDTWGMTVNTRNTIPVVSGSLNTSDNHPTIQSAVDGLHAWYGTTAFNAGDLPGTKTITVSAGTYTDEVTLNSELNPTAANPLIIQNNTGDIVTVDATGNDYGFNLNTVDYVTLTGFAVSTANLDNIYAQGDNVIISYNKTSGSVGGSGIKVETGTPFTVTNNLSYNNYKYGIEDLSSNNTIKNNTADDNGGSSSPAVGVQIYYDDLEPDVTDWEGTDTWYSFTGIFVSPDHSMGANDLIDVYISKTDPVDISMYKEITLSFYVRSLIQTSIQQANNFEAAYSFDNTNWTTFENLNTGSPGIDAFAQYSVSNLDASGTENNLYIRFRCDINRRNGGDNVSDEYWLIDDIEVEGNELGSPFQSGAGLYVANVSATVENNIFVAKSGNNSYYALISPGSSVSSDYNTYYTTNTNLFDYNGAQNNSGPLGTSDISSNPLFVGSGDYHILSTAGSYNGGEWPPTTAALGTWNNDGPDSPALDTGNPADSYTNEPASGNRINQGAYGNTLQASKSIASVTITWDGSSNTDWQTTTNWTPEQIPTSTDDIIIPDGMPNYPIIDDGTTTAVCNNMTINANASVTIATNGQMTVSGAIINNGGNAGLGINSDASGTGSLIQNTSGGVDATVKCYLTSSARQWHMLASPITSAPATVFPSTANLYFYDESTDDYWTGTSYDAGSTSGWTAFTSGNMVVAKGYIYNYFATTLTFTGQLNDNTATNAIAVPYTNNGVTTPNGAAYDDFDGWNLIGNPFTSAIDWDDASVAHAAANLNDAIYTYDDTNLHNYTSYAGGTGTNGGTKYIPAMQGFFVKSDNTETGGTLNIGAAARIHNIQGYWKSNYSTPDNFLRLQISATNGYTDETVIKFLDDATFDMDNGKDAYKLFTWDTNVPQIYTRTSGSTNYSINTLKTIETGSISIPLKAIQTGDNYSINITEFNFPNSHVYLKDCIENTTTEIGLNDVINLTSEASDSENRFELIFEKSTSGIILAENTNVALYPNPNRGSFYLTVDAASYKVKISNVTGQIVYSNKFFGNTSKIINIANQSSGIYFAEIIFNDNSKVTKKIVIE